MRIGVHSFPPEQALITPFPGTIQTNAVLLRMSSLTVSVTITIIWFNEPPNDWSEPGTAAAKAHPTAHAWTLRGSQPKFL
jgi:hypothetical protein